MHICLVSDFFGANYGGAETTSSLWVKKLLERGHKVTVLTAHPKKIFPEKNKNFKIIKFLGFPIPKAGGKIHAGLPINPFKMYKIYKLFRDEIDVVHIFLVPSLIAATAITLARWTKKPIVTSIHNQPEYVFYNLKTSPTNHKFFKLFKRIIPIKKTKLLKWSYKYITNSYLNKSDLVVGPSNFAIETYKKYGLTVPQRTISSGIDFSKFDGKGKPEIFLKKYNLTKTGNKVLFVGRLYQEKKIDILLKAAKLVLEKLPETNFILVGTGSEEDKLKLIAKKLGIEDNVLFTGRVSNRMLPNVYHASDLFVFPSILELLGLVLLEAMSAGLPLIGTDICAIPESVINGYNGYTFKKNDYRQLASKILKILQNKEIQEKFSSNSLKLVKHHDIENSIDEMEEEYRNLIQN